MRERISLKIVLTVYPSFVFTIDANIAQRYQLSRFDQLPAEDAPAVDFDFVPMEIEPVSQTDATPDQTPGETDEKAVTDTETKAITGPDESREVYTKDKKR